MNTQTPEIDSIKVRLEKLEKESRWMKRTAIVAVVSVSVLFISGRAKTNKVVTVNEFRLVDGPSLIIMDR